MRPLIALLLTGLLALPASAGAAPRLRAIARGLQSPVAVTAPAGDARLFVVEQAGRVRIVQGARRRTFLDLRSSVVSGGEEGLLSIAFHPDFPANPRFYVDYTANGAGGLETRIVEYRARGNRTVAGSARLLLRIAQPYPNHNGGQLQFGPDGFLYIGMGDGGSGDDPENRAQNPALLLGKMLRIDVDHRSGGRPYAIPATNPYRRGGGRPEIWALGVRNPWRFSFDRQTGDLWIGDVGQGRIEEVDRIRRGTGGLLNLGWDAFEGTSRHEPKPTPGRLVRPVYQYTHDDGCSISGGYVYRGRLAPSLRGRYVFADYCSSWLRSLKGGPGGVGRVQQLPGVAKIVSFGEDAKGELYAVGLETGVLYRLSG